MLQRDMQDFVDRFGFGISVAKLAEKVYWAMRALGYDVYMVNDRYVGCEDTTYYFSKSRKNGGWVVKVV